MSPSWLVLLFAAADLFSRGLGPVDTGAPRMLRAAACTGCHAAVHADWKQSRHGLAWTNAIFQREYRDRPLEWCVHCHAPLREQLAEVRRGGGPLANEGVNCAVCHVRDGRILARRQRPQSPHDTDARDDFGGPGYCGGCHQFNFPVIAGDGTAGPAEPRPGVVTGYTAHPMQDTVHQHARGPRADKECLSCHQRDPGSHRFPGAHDGQMITGALTIATCRDRHTLVVDLANTGAGHNVPTGDVHRHLVLRAWHPSAPEKLQEVTLGRRFAPAPPPDAGKLTVADTTIPAGEARRLRLPITPERGSREPLSLELRLVYTIDEFPFRGRELDEPTFATVFARQLDWAATPACPAGGPASPTPRGRAPSP